MGGRRCAGMPPARMLWLLLAPAPVAGVALLHLAARDGLTELVQLLMAKDAAVERGDVQG